MSSKQRKNKIGQDYYFFQRNEISRREKTYSYEIIAYQDIKRLSTNITTKQLAKKYLTHAMISGYIHKAPPYKEYT